MESHPPPPVMLYLNLLEGLLLWIQNFDFISRIYFMYSTCNVQNMLQDYAFFNSESPKSIDLILFVT